MWIGFLLMILGALMLLDRMGLIRGGIWDYFWPVVIIAIGASLIFKSKKHEQS